MEKEENCAGGETILLDERDDLTAVPASHRHLLTPALREAFVDPPAYFSGLAKRCPFPSMAKWLQHVIDDGFWDLHLGLSAPECGDWSLAGYWCGHERIVCAIVGLPPRAPSNLPTTLLQYYSLVDVVHWSVFGAAGGFDGASGHSPLAENFPHYAEEKTDADKLRVWGTSCGGDLLIYSLDNQGGWLCHETGEIHWLGTIADTINWVFGEMLENRVPDFNYDWLRKKE